MTGLPANLDVLDLLEALDVLDHLGLKVKHRNTHTHCDDIHDIMTMLIIMNIYIYTRIKVQKASEILKNCYDTSA